MILKLMPAAGKACLQRLRHIGEGCRIDHVERDVDRCFHTRIGQDLLGLCGVVGVGVVVQRAREARRPEGLVDLHLPLEEGICHALVIDEIAGSFPDGRIGQVLVLLVEG